MSNAEKLLRELVALPSVNPELMPSGDARAGELRVAEFLAATAAAGGLEVELAPVLPGRPNLLARLAPAGRVRRRLLLAPHSDTVGEPSMSDDYFRPVKRHGRLHGRGACDTKGCVAAMLSALLAVARAGARPGETEIVLAVLADEEAQQLGSRRLIAEGFKADFAVVGEPTCLKVVTAHKGAVRFTLETVGRAAHGARPELGRNAIHAMARAVDLIETRYAQLLRRRRHPLLGCPTINVGWIQGGVQANTVPDRCQIKIDRRTIPGESSGSVRAELESLLRGNGLKVRFCPSAAERSCKPMETDPDLPWAQSLRRLAGQRAPAGVNYFSDASILSHGGIPTVIFGPGDIAQAHTADEWISIGSLERGAALLETFLRSLP